MVKKEKMKKTYDGENGIALEDEKFEYAIEWESGLLNVAIRDRKTKKYVFDKSFDTKLKDFC